jgi:iron(III) transport system ATP-binding protein
MEGFEDRPAPLLSGGQQQRVALARALVYEPGVLLLDEPLSNLDAKLRQEMRLELRELVTRLKVTTVYVTHDQEEALVLADRVAVMHNGLLKQVGTPWELYLRPADDFVARFVGDVNLIPASIEGKESSTNGTMLVRSAFGLLECHVVDPLPAKEAITIMIRPEAVVVHSAPSEATGNSFPGIVRRTIFVGSKFQCEIELGETVIRGELPPWSDVKVGQRINAEFPASRIQVLRQ